MKEQPNVTVIGSINMDLTVTTEEVPDQGETVLGESFATYPGGKGANQAVAASRLGANVNMIGAVGDDVFGKDLISHLQQQNVNTSSVVTIEGSTGTATIILSNNDNRIIVVPGANSAVTPEFVEEQIDLIKESDILLLQLEIPLETVAYVTQLAKKFDIPVVINPAPYQTLPQEVWMAATYLTPNESEARTLQTQLIDYKGHLITTKGAAGLTINHQDLETAVGGFQVPVSDTTGAGDTFNGALATYIARGYSVEKAAYHANAAAALSITKKGAQSGMPTLAALEAFLAEGRFSS